MNKLLTIFAIAIFILPITSVFSNDVKELQNMDNREKDAVSRAYENSIDNSNQKFDNTQNIRESRPERDRVVKEKGNKATSKEQSGTSKKPE